MPRVSKASIAVAERPVVAEPVAPVKSRATADPDTHYTIVENPHKHMFILSTDDRRTGSIILEPREKQVLSRPELWKKNLRFQEMLRRGAITVYEADALPEQRRQPLPDEIANQLHNDPEAMEKAYQMTEVEDFAEFKRFVELKPRDGKTSSDSYKDGLSPQARNFLIGEYLPRLRASLFFETHGGLNRQERVEVYLQRIQYIENLNSTVTFNF